jgi:Domain of unknown function (DUF4129)
VTRFWNEAVALLGDVAPGGVTGAIFLSLVLTLLVALGWYYWPAWLPWNWRWRAGRRSGGNRRTGTGWRGRFRLGRLRWRLRFRRRRRDRTAESPADLPPDQLPDVPAEVLVLTADQLAAQGRYAEAVRERLRAMLRELIERGIIPFSPGWTVTELAAVARQSRPALAPPLHGAVDVFSEIWYGLRPARLDDDQAMRAHAEQLRQSLSVPVAP